MAAPCTGLGADDALLHLGSSGDLQRQTRKQQGGGDKLLKMSASTVFLKHHYRDRKEKKKETENKWRKDAV